MIPSLTEITVENFFSIREAVTYRLENQGLVVITGRNGQGKTTLFMEAILWLVYAISLEYGQKPGGSVRNRHDKGDARVSGIISTDSGIWKVTRTRGKSQGTLTLKLLVGEEWTDAEQTTMSLTQEKLETIWGRDSGTFLNSGMFTSDVLRYPDLPDEQKKAIIDRLINVQSVREAYDRVFTEVRETEEKHVFCKGALGVHVETLARLESRLRQKKVLSDEFEEQHSGARERAQKRGREIAKELQRLADAIVEGEGLIQGWADTISATSTKCDKVASVLAPLVDQTHEAKARYRSIASKLSDKRKLAEAGLCSTCGASTAAVQSEIPKLEERHNTLLDEFEHYNNLQSQLDARHRKLKSKLSEAQETERELAQELKTARRKVESLRSEEATLSREVKDFDNPHTQDILNLRENIVHEKSAHLLRIEETDTLHARLQDLSVLQDAFGNRGLRTILLENALPAITDKLANKLATIGSSIRVILSISDAGKLIIDVDNPEGAGQYHGCSAGERRLIDLALLFSFFEFYADQNGGYPPQIIFDEAFEKVDDGWQEQLGRILKDIVEKGTSVFFLAHSAPRLEGMADHVWTVSGARLYQA